MHNNIIQWPLNIHTQSLQVLVVSQAQILEGVGFGTKKHQAVDFCGM